MPAPPRSDPTTVCDVFVKIGGSILDHDAATAALVPHLVEQGTACRLVVLTGGGRTVKRIKANQRARGSDFYDCWQAGVQCLDVNAYLLASYSTSFAVAKSTAQIGAAFDARRVAIFASGGTITNSLELVPDWQVTTDSMGLYFAHSLGARRYVIVSDVDGIYEKPPRPTATHSPIAQLDIERLRQLESSKMDPSFPTFFRRFGLPTVVVNGNHPERVGAAIRGTPTLGTVLVPAA